MNTTRFAVLTLVLGLQLALPAAALAQKQVTLLATVTDPSGGQVAALDAADVRVSENGNAATVVKVEPVDRVPKLHLLIDNGIGIPSESFGDLRKGLRGLVDALPPDLDVSLVSTAPQPRFLERGTKEREKLIKALNLLSPDRGAGRFVESLSEATQRIERDKDSNNVIVAVGTTSGDVNVRDTDIRKIQEHIAGGRTRVHVIIVSGAVGSSLSGGGAQLEIGEVVAKNSRGRFENINIPNRLATLLPEIGADVARTMGAASRQFRITVDRPAGSSGALGKLSVGIAGVILSNVTIESR
jgi:hypothetical protein